MYYGIFTLPSNSLVRCRRQFGDVSVVHHKVLVEEHSSYGMFFRFVSKYISYKLSRCVHHLLFYYFLGSLNISSTIIVFQLKHTLNKYIIRIFIQRKQTLLTVFPFHSNEIFLTLFAAYSCYCSESTK